MNTSALSCRVDGMDVRATYLSEKEIVCHSRVAGDLAISNDGRAFSSPYQVAGRAAITIEDVSIRRASSQGGDAVRVTGRGFSSGVECAFGAHRVKARVVNDKELTCIVPSSSFDGALRTAPLTVRRGDITSSPVAFYTTPLSRGRGAFPSIRFR